MKIKDITTRDEVDDESMLKALKTLVDIFESLELKYWMEAGNLLGAVRDGKLIPWDFDIDIGLQYSEQGMPDKIKKELGRRGFKTEYLGFNEKEAKGVVNKNFLMAKKEGFANMDIHMHNLPKNIRAISAMFYYLPTCIRKSIIKFAQITYFSNEKLRPKSSYVRDIKLKRTRMVQHMMPIFFCHNVKKITFYDFKVNIPAKSEEYLLLNYGVDWKIPKRKFTTYIG